MRDWQNFYTAEDAEPSDIIYRAKVISIEKASAILRAELKNAKMVYKIRMNGYQGTWYEDLDKVCDISNSALLVDKREIEK